jgi:hypothetical protein
MLRIAAHAHILDGRRGCAMEVGWRLREGRCRSVAPWADDAAGTGQRAGRLMELEHPGRGRLMELDPGRPGPIAEPGCYGRAAVHSGQNCTWGILGSGAGRSGSVLARMRRIRRRVRPIRYPPSHATCRWLRTSSVPNGLTARERSSSLPKSPWMKEWPESRCRGHRLGGAAATAWRVPRTRLRVRVRTPDPGPGTREGARFRIPA